MSAANLRYLLHLVMVGSLVGEMNSSPCGACKFLRRKCAAECVFAPHFGSEQGPARFAAIHKVFGASNASKMLLQLPLPDRFDAIVTIGYEAQARIRNPVHGCVAHIFALEQQVVYLQDELMRTRAQLAAHQWATVAAEFPTMQGYPSDYSSSLDSVDGFSGMQCYRDDEVVLLQHQNKRKRPSHAHDLTELQQMALMMLNNGN